MACTEFIELFYFMMWSIIYSKEAHTDFTNGNIALFVDRHQQQVLSSFSIAGPVLLYTRKC